MIGSKIIKLDQVDSTNQFLQKTLKEREIEEGTIVIALEQTLGRGQRENRWESKKGENLTLSFVLFPEWLKATDQFLLSKSVSVAIIEFLKPYLKQVKIKWPNDIIAGKKKIAGVLIENVIKGAHISSSVIGIGLNINQESFGPELPFATSLFLETGINHSLNILLEQFVKSLNNQYQVLATGDRKKLNEEYLKELYQYEEFHDYKANNQIFTAKITGIDEDGRLCLRSKNNKLLKFAFKEVQFL